METTENFFSSTPNAFTQELFSKLKRHPKRIVFPEGEDLRVLRVAEEMVKREIISPILLGNKKRIQNLAKEQGISLEFVGLIEPEKSSDMELFCERFQKIERFRGKQHSDPKKIIGQPHHFASMMVQYGQADGLVGGLNILPAAFFRALFRMIKPLPTAKIFSSCTIHHYPQHPEIGHNGTLILGDCAILEEPRAEQLAMIGIESSKLARLLFGDTPRVAFLSYSTKGSADSATVRKVIAATALAKQRAQNELVDILIDGEIQPGVALKPEEAMRKDPSNILKGKANVLVFPDLNSGHISERLLQTLGGAESYGQILLGLSSPAAHVSRVANEKMILGTAALVGLHAVRYHELYPEGLGE